MKESKIEASLRIGQQGLTESVVIEIRSQLKRKKVIKVKRLRTTSLDGTEKEFWQEVARQAGARLLEVRGHTAVLGALSYVTAREASKGRRPVLAKDEEE